jgi:hypothetical protein
LRNADDLAIQEVVLGPLVTMVGILGLWLHGAMRTGKKSRWVFEDSMWALRSRAGFALCIPIGIWATAHGLLHQPHPLGR